MTNLLRWGILGTGKIARQLAESINESTTSRLVAVGSRTLHSAIRFGDEFAVPNRHGSYDALLGDPEVDIIYISLPNNLHAEWTVRCADAKKHVLCEKPFAVTATEAEEAVHAAKRNDVFLMEAFMYRTARQTHKVVEMVKSGIIGDVRLIHAVFSYNMPLDLENIRFRYDVAGGAIMDVGCYSMSYARLIAGAATGQSFADPLEINAQSHINPVSKVDEWSTAIVRFPGDILATLTCGTQVAMERAVRIYGSEGSIEIPQAWKPGLSANDSNKIIVTKGSNVEEIVIPAGVPLFTQEVDDVAAHIAHRESPSMPLADILGQQRALDMWREAAGVRFPQDELAASMGPTARLYRDI